MTVSVTHGPLADDDIDAFFEYYAQEGGRRLALRFLDAFEHARSRMAEFPEMGAPRDSLVPGMRVVLIPGFPSIGVYYRVLPDHVRIDRLLHGSRDLGDIFALEQ